jgi:GNAT superfamily N-acetyltransferase
MFAKHHYLSHSHNNAATVYVATVNDQIAGFLSVLHFPHPHAKNIKKVHRLVILPDYQGAGFGVTFLNEIGKHYMAMGNKYNIVTSSPSLINALKKSDKWRCLSYGRSKPVGNSSKRKELRSCDSTARITASFQMRNQ